MKNDAPKTKSGGASIAREDVSGAVPMHHRLKMGMGDGVSDPNGDGNPSTKPTLANQGGKSW